MEFQLVPCGVCRGVVGAWNEMCGGCGHWVLMGTHDGKRYAAPMNGERVAPWVGKPSEDVVEAEKAALLALVAWAPVTGDNVTVRTVEITGQIGSSGVEIGQSAAEDEVEFAASVDGKEVHFRGTLRPGLRVPSGHD